MSERNILITGSASGLGRCLYKECCNAHLRPIGVDIKKSTTTDFVCDLTKEGEIISLSLTTNGVYVFDTIINNAGINYLSPISAIESEKFDEVFSINVKAPVLMVKYFLPHLIKTQGTVVNVVSNAYKMPMTHSTAYNGSKGALEIITRQMARELTKQYGITVFGINPNKMSDTEMSHYIEEKVPDMRGWTHEQAKEYQKQSLLTGEETDPARVAEHLIWLLAVKERHKYLSGCLLDLGA